MFFFQTHSPLVSNGGGAGVGGGDGGGEALALPRGEAAGVGGVGAKVVLEGGVDDARGFVRGVVGVGNEFEFKVNLGNLAVLDHSGGARGNHEHGREDELRRVHVVSFFFFFVLLSLLREGCCAWGSEGSERRLAKQNDADFDVFFKRAT